MNLLNNPSEYYADKSAKLYRAAEALEKQADYMSANQCYTEASSLYREAREAKREAYFTGVKARNL